MAWTANLIRNTRTASEVNAEIEYTDGTLTFQETLKISNTTKRTQIAQQVKNRLAVLANLDVVDKVAIGPVDLTVLDPTPPTQVEIDLKTWVDNFSKLTVAMRLVSVGGLSATDQVVTDLQTLVRNTFKIEYLDIIG